MSFLSINTILIFCGIAGPISTLTLVHIHKQRTSAKSAKLPQSFTDDFQNIKFYQHLSLLMWVATGYLSSAFLILGGALFWSVIKEDIQSIFKESIVYDTSILIILFIVFLTTSLFLYVVCKCVFDK